MYETAKLSSKGAVKVIPSCPTLFDPMDYSPWNSPGQNKEAVLYHYIFLLAMNENSCCSTPSTSFNGISVPNFGHSNRCIVVSDCFFFIVVLICISLMSDIWWGISFHMLICHMWIFFGEVCIMVFVSFLIWLFVFLLLNSKSSLFLDVSFADIFPSLSLISLLLTFSFTERKVLVLMKCSLSIISFMNHAFGVVSKKTPSYPRSFRFSSILYYVF